MFLEWHCTICGFLCWPKIKDVHHHRTKFQHETVLENIFKISYLKHLTIILTGIIFYQLYGFCFNQNSRKASHLSQHTFLLCGSEDVLLYFIAKQISSVDMFCGTAAFQVAGMAKIFLMESVVTFWSNLPSEQYEIKVGWTYLWLQGLLHAEALK